MDVTDLFPLPGEGADQVIEQLIRPIGGNHPGWVETIELGRDPALFP